MERVAAMQSCKAIIERQGKVKEQGERGRVTSQNVAAACQELFDETGNKTATANGTFAQNVAETLICQTLLSRARQGFRY
jgi:hypothetical protein